MTPGMIGYYPEAVHYGPQTQEEGQMLSSLTLQFGGASGSGYIGRDEQAAVTTELRKLGEFKNGAFRRNKDVPGKRNLDGFQAIWEHAKQRPLTYPEPRYEAPILMDPDRFEWLPVEGAPGVEEKPMGVFTECRTMAGFLKLEPGAVYEATGARDIFFVLSGEGAVDGEPLRYATTVFLDPGESARFTADTQTNLLHLRLPNLAHLKGEPRLKGEDKVSLEAAE